VDLGGGTDHKRSPFPRSSLPQAGESLRDAAYEFYLDKYWTYVVMAITFTAVAATEWVMHWLGSVVPRYIWTGFAVVMSAFATWRYFRIKPQLEMLNQGVRGERQIGRLHEETRALGVE
jgi:hypothetical protein